MRRSATFRTLPVENSSDYFFNVEFTVVFRFEIKKIVFFFKPFFFNKLKQKETFNEY